MYDYHHFNNPRLLKDHFEKLDKIAAAAIVHREAAEEYKGAIKALNIVARACGLEADGLIVEARQISCETGISFVDAAEKVKEKYLK